MEKFVLLCIFLVGTFLKLSNGQVTCNNKDADSSCGTWKQSGFCTHSHVEYMRKNCMKSCGTCANPNPAVTCNNKDGDRNCNIWTNLGFCEGVHEAYMEKNCMKSCKQCGVVAVNCAWGNWVAWSVCSVTCGSGTRTRTRAKSTSASNGGVKCPGLPLASEPCKLNACAGAPVCGKKPAANQCTTGQVCINPDTPCAKCGPLVCGTKLGAKQCTSGQVCSNPDTPLAKCGPLVCGKKLGAKQCTSGQVCSNPDTPLAKCGAPVCGAPPSNRCKSTEICINSDTPSAKCELKCGPGLNSVCLVGSTTPSCLDFEGKTPTFATNPTATCKCTNSTCISGLPPFTTPRAATAPVCHDGNGRTNGNGNAGLGVCGRCLMIQAFNTAKIPSIVQANNQPPVAPSTCPLENTGCCNSGACVPYGTNC